MKKFLYAIRLKQVLAVALCFMLCFSCVFFVAGCDSTKSTGEQTTGKDDDGTGSIVLTINANGGLYDGYDVLEVVRAKGAVIELKNPTYQQSAGENSVVFEGWVLFSGDGNLSGNTFTFGERNSEVRATWSGGIIDELNEDDYIKGATFIYKNSPQHNGEIDALKSLFTQKISTLLTNIETYTGITLSSESEELSIEETVLLKFLEKNYGEEIGEGILDAKQKINKYLSYVDHYGLFESEKTNLLDIMLNYLCEAKQQQANEYLANHPDIASKIEKENPTILDIDEVLYTNKDNVLGFGAETYSGTINETSNTISNFSISSVNDLNENGAFDLWTKETFIAKGLCTEETYNYDEYHYALKYDENNKMVLDVAGVDENYIIDSITVHSAANAVNQKDLTLYVFKDANSNYVYDKNPDTNVNDPELLYYYDINGSYYTYLTLSNAVELYSYQIVGAIKNNTYYPASDYAFDIAQTDFKNYKNVFKYAVENVMGNWKIVPIVYIQQLEKSEMNVDVSNLDADFYDNKILTNKTDSGLILSGVLLDIKQQVNIKNIEIYFEYVDEDNIGLDEITISVGAIYFNKQSQEIDSRNFGNVKVTEGKQDAVSATLGEETTNGITINFANIYENGISLNPLETKLNDGNYILDESLNAFYKTKSIEELENYDECLSAKKGTNTSVVTYIDESSDYLILTFECLESVPFKICFFSFGLAGYNEN